MTFEREPRGPRPVLNRRRRGALAPTLVVVGVLIILGLIFAQIWTDVLWYQQLGYLQVYRTELFTRAVLFVVGGVVMGLAVGSSLLIGYRSRPIYAPVSAEQAGLDRYRDSIEPLRRLVAVAVPVVIGLFAGSAAGQQWQTVQLWLHSTSFGTKDPQFHLDVSFFVFTLPWLQFLVGFLTAATFLAGLAAGVTHYLYGGLRLQGGGQRLTSAARVHLSVLAAIFLLLRGIGYWLGRYALSTKDSRLITGLTYTDANAVLTARGVLAGIAVLVAVLFLVTAFMDQFRLLPLYGVALLVVSAIVVGGILPAGVQRFKVTPNAQALERKYIQHNIDATRAAYGLSNVQSENYDATTDAEPEALRKDADTASGIRLVDPSLVSDTFRQLQQIKQYYSFPDSLDVDRYDIDGQTQDAVVAVRELDLDQPALTSQRNWVNDHIVYTHGFGLVGAYGTQSTPGGQPVFFQQDIPSTGKLKPYEPRVYFGEKSPDYSIVGGAANGPKRELDYPDDSGTNEVNTTYAGAGGVKIGSLFRKLLYAIKFREQNILLSSAVNDQSKIMYDRSPRERVQKVAPFLTLDGDPYPAVIDGRIKWIVDGYTTSANYPYSRSKVLEEATSDSITALPSSSVVALDNRRINYIRNSVKATVDAYDGSVTLYSWDQKDPVLKSWEKIFPGAVQPQAKIDSQLMSHIRYPEDLFKVQRDLMQTYHVTDANGFYSGQDFWEVPDDPTRNTNSLQPAYYLTLQMPGQDQPTFSLSTAFVPKGRTRNVLTGFMAVDADAGDTPGQPRPGYGQFRLLKLPSDSPVSGPGQVQSNFNSDTEVAQQIKLLEGTSSTVERGNLLTLPLAGGLLYVQPVYVRGGSGTGTGTFPLLRKIVVGFGSEIGFADTLADALDQVFGNSSGTGSGTGTGTGGTGSGGTAGNTALQNALDDAQQALADSDAALKKGDFTAYGAAQKRLQQAIEAAIAAEDAASKARTTPSASASASATPRASASASATPRASASP
ncbi:UPF0182 family protein [Spongisporangium articulatum]|uniref:UPF0182 protein ACIB24_14830 n=1 Tax=Spongisporangium articulatum TaxID=3362603 RepID=A0ABW8APS4_9ACTN